MNAPQRQPPIFTVGQPGDWILPVGDGIGATQPACIDASPTRAAAIPQIFTVPEPAEMIPGPLGTQLANMQIIVMSPTRAAGILPIMTVGAPKMIASGTAGWATGVGTGAAG